MYSTCLFCNGQLGKNEVIEHFPVGRRLAFDGAKGRLWVVCRKCERWNLTPLEERWEAIEECERLFRDTRLRVSTDHIGLARLKEGLELVRIGEPQRPEMAAWRYGDQFGRRRRRHYTMIAGGVAVVGVALVAGPMLGVIGAGAFQPMWQVANAGRSIYRTRTLIHLPSANDSSLRIRLSELPKTKLFAEGDGIMLRVNAVPHGSATPWYRFASSKRPVELRGEDAIRAAGILLPRLNQGGGSQEEVKRAVGYLEDMHDPLQLYRYAAGILNDRKESSTFHRSGENALRKLPTAGRLALEMASHEESERRALEGELHVLEEAWRSAEEIAGIADDMFMPASMDDDLARLKARREAE
ncbi:MAG: hypothetical protein ABJE47_01345 [bacterium]